MNDQLSDEQKAAFEQELEDTSVKALLIQQNALLQQLVMQLSEPQEQEQEQAPDPETPKATCRLCGESHPVDELKDHAIDHHNAPADIDYASVGDAE